MKERLYAIATVVSMLFVAGCGSYPAPTERLTGAEAALRGANEVGALQIPRAALHLKLAEEQIEKAKRYMQDGYNQRAELALRRARADAELALAIAHEHKTQEKTEAARQELAKVKAQYGR